MDQQFSWHTHSGGTQQGLSPIHSSTTLVDESMNVLKSLFEGLHIAFRLLNTLK